MTKRYVMYKTDNAWYMTTETNYNSRIRDASAITSFENMATIEEVTNYIKRYLNTDGITITIKE